MTAAPLRVFVSTGEASGELLAADLIGAMRALGAVLDADGIGGERLEAVGVRLTQRSAGWASMGPIDALGKIPRLLAVATRTAVAIRTHPYDLIVMVDFGALSSHAPGGK
jgi:lipid-A-disaccharide synthase